MKIARAKILLGLTLLGSVSMASKAEKITFAEGDTYNVGRCILKVDGHTYLNGRCAYSMDKDSIFFRQIRPRNYYFHFAYVFFESPKSKNAEAFWNENLRSFHAEWSLGKVVRNGNCWKNQRAKLCVWPSNNRQ